MINPAKASARAPRSGAGGDRTLERERMERNTPGPAWDSAISPAARAPPPPGAEPLVGWAGRASPGRPLRWVPRDVAARSRPAAPGGAGRPGAALAG
jgi:hypothetical protein